MVLLIKKMAHGGVLKHNENADTIERIIDENNVHYVLELVAEVLSAKADHVREAWQDESLAEAWDNSAGVVLACAMKFNN